MNTLIKKLTLIIFLLPIAQATITETKSMNSNNDTIAIVVNNSNNNPIDQHDVKKIYLGKIKSYKNGNKINAYDLPTDNASRKIFITKFLNRSESRLNSYWARMLFSSRATPPIVKNSIAEIKHVLAKDPDAIAYIPLSDVDTSMKIVLTSNSF